MDQLFKVVNGMNLVGQGGTIILFTLPFAALAVWLQFYQADVAALPHQLNGLKYVGYFLFLPGVLLWLTGLVQLLRDFPKGKLITTGAYGICRNPIYTSMILFILPAISFATLTWVYLVVALMLYEGLRIFIGKEEAKLLQVFGNEYEDYMAKVSRVMPFVKPASKI